MTGKGGPDVVEGQHDSIGDGLERVPDESDGGEVRVPGIEDIEAIGHSRHGVLGKAVVLKCEEYGGDEIHGERQAEADGALKTSLIP
jgi:hypothetical protein